MAAIDEFVDEGVQLVRCRVRHAMDDLETGVRLAQQKGHLSRRQEQTRAALDDGEQFGERATAVQTRDDFAQDVECQWMESRQGVGREFVG